MNLLEAMARQEGFLLKGSRPQKNNNPGDIEYGRFAQAHGATASDTRFAIFPNVTTGYKAMAALLRSAYLGLDVHHAVYKWLGYTKEQADKAVTAPNEQGNYPAVYIEHVCEWSGLKPTDVIDSHLEIPA